MDDFNRKMMEARRRAAIDHTQRMDREAEQRAAEPEPPRPAPPAAGSGRLQLRRTQGEWRYYLAEERVRSGDTIEFFVGPGPGWLRGVFEWGRRNTSAPVLRVRIVHPDDRALFLGDAAVTLPEEAVCRWPEG